MEAASIAELLAENKAQLSNLAEHQGLGEDILVRFWTVGQDDLDGCVAYLKAQTIITDPMTGTRWARTGTWYAGAVDYKPGNVNPLVASGAAGLIWILYQQLSKGDKVITINEVCAAYTKQKIIHTYNPFIPSGTAPKGQIITVEAQPTELGREQTIQETTTPTDQVSVSNDVSKSAESLKTVHTENATPLIKPAATKGLIVTQEAQPTPAGNERTVVVETTPTDQLAVSVDNSKSGVSTKTVHTENAVDLTPAAIVKGTITTQEAQPTPAGNQRTVVAVTVPTDQVATSYDVSKSAESTKVVHTENDTPLTKPSATKGTIVAQEAQPTPAGNERTVVVETTPTDQTADSFEKSALETIAETFHSEKADALPDEVLADGTTVEVVNKPTTAGNYQTVRRVRTGVYVLTDVTYVDRYGNSYFARGLNATETQFAAAVSAAALTASWP